MGLQGVCKVIEGVGHACGHAGNSELEFLRAWQSIQAQGVDLSSPRRVLLAPGSHTGAHAKYKPQHGERPPRHDVARLTNVHLTARVRGCVVSSEPALTMSLVRRQKVAQDLVHCRATETG